MNGGQTQIKLKLIQSVLNYGIIEVDKILVLKFRWFRHKSY